MNSILGSWKTTVAGFVAGLIIMIRSLAGIGGVEVPTFNADGSPVLDENGALVMTDAGSFNMETFLLGLSLMGIGAAARDSNKSSEDVRAK